MSDDRRWPGWVYGSGEEPDPRFSFANERTFLAWLRTALALMAAGVAVDAFDLRISATVQQFLAVVLVLLGLLAAVAAYTRWARAERAMRRGDPLPASAVSAVLAAVVVGCAVVLVVTLL